MEKVLSSQAVQASLQQAGLSQAELARQLGVSAQAVTNWLKGADFPRPDKLLKLAVLLKLSFDQLVLQPQTVQPIIAFRKKAGAKTTDAHISRAKAIGMLLKPLVPYLQGIHTIRPQLANPSTGYTALQQAVSEARTKLGLGDQAILDYHHLIGQFKEAGAVLIPVLWGAKNRHENALHIHLPQEKVTFIFLNLDTSLEDFKFWMAHELAHVYTPALAGTEEGEDFADAFAGALLFPQACAEQAYLDASRARTPSGVISALQKHAVKHNISLYTVFRETSHFVQYKQLPPLKVEDSKIHVVRNAAAKRIPYVSEAIFDPLPPSPAEYIAATDNGFQSDFFRALRAMILEREMGAGYIQQILDISLADATALHAELTR